MSPYNIVDHASDIGIEVEAKTLEDLFSDAVQGLFFLVTDKTIKDFIEESNIYKNKIRKKKINIRYSLVDSALIELLNRIILLTYSHGILFFNPFIKIRRKRVILKANIIKDGFSFMEREIKAATYHNFSIKNKKDSYSTTIIFDI